MLGLLCTLDRAATNFDQCKECCMSHGNHDQVRLGFLTAVEDAERGFVGGLLITNRFGRPLEFQCTAPVKPNRTQQILYGPTLKPYVLSELIGRTLLEKVGVKPHLVLVETPDLLDLRNNASTLIASLLPVEETAKKRNSGQPENRQSEQNVAHSLRFANETIVFNPAHSEDRTEIEKFAKLMPSDADLREPFERIREALIETIRLSMSRPA
jgi:hypothetical protein